ESFASAAETAGEYADAARRLAPATACPRNSRRVVVTVHLRENGGRLQRTLWPRDRIVPKGPAHRQPCVPPGRFARALADQRGRQGISASSIIRFSRAIALSTFKRAQICRVRSLNQAGLTACTAAVPRLTREAGSGLPHTGNSPAR